MAALALHASDDASIDLLQDYLWSAAPPASARGTIQRYIYNLRRSGFPIETTPDGYRLTIDRSSVDVLDWDHQVDGVRAAVRGEAPDPNTVIALARRALAQRRGPIAVAGLDASIKGQSKLQHFNEQFQRLNRHLAEALNRTGAHEDAVDALRAAVAEQPYHDPFWILMMRSLYSGGRRQEALESYKQAEAALDDLDLSPSPELVATRNAVLRDQSALLVNWDSVAPAEASSDEPAAAALSAADPDLQQHLAEAIVSYGEQLRKDRRDGALVSLRNSFTMTLHILGFHELRSQLGTMALESAAVLQDVGATVSILIDDIGWAKYLVNEGTSAVENITRGLEIARTRRAGLSPSAGLELALSEAKGLRHLALIHSLDEDRSDLLLAEAESVLTGLRDSEFPQVRRDLAQLRHAKALSTATRLQVHKGGYLAPDDATGRTVLESALHDVRYAAQEFRDLQDFARYTKALFLEVRLLEAKGAEGEAQQVRVLRDRILAISDWTRPEATSTLTGV